MSTSDATIDCPACGAENPVDHAYCGTCGARVGSGMADSLIGKVIADRFRVKRLLASGGMGSIYLAEHVGIGKRVAIKLLRADLRGHPHLAKRFRREAMAVSKLTDAHTITVFDFGVWEGVVYLVMEYLAGRDLSKVIEDEGRLTPRRALVIAHQICSSLGEAHSVGVVHRDLKPENVFITRTTSGDELVKVLDFGLAKILNPAESAAALVQTADGALMGTPYYMAPEQVRGEAVDARTDLYALGGLLFRMLTGQAPYTGKTPLQVMEGHVSGRLRTFEEVDPALDVPAPVEALVRRLLARRPEDRPESALGVDAEVVALLDGLPPERTDQPRPIEVPAPAVEPAPPARPMEPTPPSRPAAFELRAESPSAPSSGPPSGPQPGPSAPSSAPRSRPPPDRHPLAFDDDPAAPPGHLGAPRDPAARSWVLGDSAPPSPAITHIERDRERGRGGGLILAIVALLVFGGLSALYLWLGREAPPPLRFEVEPNDSAAEATPMVAGSPIRGRVGLPDGRVDRDVFIVEVPEDRRFARITLDGVAGLDLVLEGFAYADGKALFTANANGAGGGEQVERRVEGDRLLVTVRGKGPEDRDDQGERRSYRLRVELAADARGLPIVDAGRAAPAADAGPDGG
ncbi:MAG: serine/threonine-protein kinase [bacterium]